MQGFTKILDEVGAIATFSARVLRETFQHPFERRELIR